MKLLAKFVGLIVLGVFIFAFVMGAFGAPSIKGLKEKVDGTKTVATEKKEPTINTKVPFPAEFNSGSTTTSMKPIEITSIEEVKSLLAQGFKVMMIVDNTFLRNPFVEDNVNVPVVLVGYNETHLISSGAEIGASKFIYLTADFWEAFVSSNGKAWVVEG